MNRYALRPCAGVLACALAGALPWLAHAQTATPVAELDTTTVTAARVAADTDRLPVAYSIVTQQDIANSSARTVQELLSTQTGIHVFTSSGSSDRQSIDLRGFGMTGISNTLVLIDGIRQTDNDLSPPALGAIPLANIERIEIIRGSGAVQYGGGTTGGVINIITKNGFDSPHTVQATYTIGNYGLRQLDGAVAIGNEHFALDAYGQSLRTDNYRDNNAERRDSGGAGLTLRHDGGSLRGYVRSANQKLGLPGPRAINPGAGIDEYRNDRRGTNSPDDYARVRTEAYGLQLEQRVGPGTLYADLGQRDKEVYGFLGSSFGDTVNEYDINESSASARYLLPFNGGHSLVVGADWQRGTLDGSSSGAFANDTWRTKMRQHGLFAEAQIQATASTVVTLGGRRQSASQNTDPIDGFRQATRADDRLGAWQAGIRQQLPAGLSAYAHIGRSFRLPNADELAATEFSAAGTAIALRPQTSVDKEIGLDWRAASTRARLSLFQNDLDNEIHYQPSADGSWGPGTGANVNLDPTRRRGVELEAAHDFSPAWSVNGNVTWLQAKFRSGTYAGVDVAGNEVPLVPRWLANAGVTWRPIADLSLNASVQYVGKSRLDNDQANDFGQRLDSYFLTNARATYRFSKHVEAGVAVHNLFDRKYATYGIRSLFTPGVYNLYPAAERSVMASLTVRY